MGILMLNLFIDINGIVRREPRDPVASWITSDTLHDHDMGYNI
jgi:hypothetical protein